MKGIRLHVYPPGGQILKGYITHTPIKENWKWLLKGEGLKYVAPLGRR